MGLIYFGHSRMLYNTNEEKKAIEIIRKKFPKYKILNPNSLEHQINCNETIPGSEIDYFLNLTNSCEIGVFLVYDKNKWSPGSYTEANYMLNCGKSIYITDIYKCKIERLYKIENHFTFEEEKIRLLKEGKDPLMLIKEIGD